MHALEVGGAVLADALDDEVPRARHDLAGEGGRGAGIVGHVRGGAFDVEDVAGAEGPHFAEELNSDCHAHIGILK